MDINDDCIFHLLNFLNWTNMLSFGATNTRYRNIIAPYILRRNQIQIIYESRCFNEIFAVFGSYFTNIQVVFEEFFAPDPYYNSFVLSLNNIDELLQTYAISAANIIGSINDNANVRLQSLEYIYSMRFIFTDYLYLQRLNVFYDTISDINHDLFLNLRRGNMISNLLFVTQDNTVQLILQINF